ncbi:MAG: saccharopine dehydrogenase [Akkermansiaceae bacterium]|nr:saccharopine dehydrogenase [Akkermansiaceae bacterium]
MKSPHVWLRSETKTFERRTPLTPGCARELVAAGFEVTVERCDQRIYDDDAYQRAGCRLTEPGRWPEASKDTIILGLKELPEDSFPLVHAHIYFAHAYKEQEGWRELLARFTKGGGRLYDLEYLVDEDQRRIAAFGYWAGFAGAAIGLLAWAKQQGGARPPLGKLSAFENKNRLIEEVSDSLAKSGTRPRVLVIGAKGRSGRGAVDAATAAGLEVVPWDLEETRGGGPFARINAMDILVNCVFVNGPLPPFLTEAQLRLPGRRLSVIVDVSCDVHSRFNPLPVYSRGTDFREPCLELIAGEHPLDLIAIDHLPTLLPVESSEDYSRQLLGHLLTLGDRSNPVWDNALRIFQQKSAALAANIKEPQ